MACLIYTIYSHKPELLYTLKKNTSRFLDTEKKYKFFLIFFFNLKFIKANTSIDQMNTLKYINKYDLVTLPDISIS